MRLISLPPEDLRNGDFSATGVTIYDPLSNPDPSKRTPFPGDKIPANRIDPAALWLIQRMPLPNGPGYSNNYSAQGTGTYLRDNIDVKLNYHANERLSMFARYSLSPSDIYDPPSLGPAGGDALNGGQLGDAPGRTQVAGLGATYTFSPNLLLDANIGYTRQRLGAEFDLNRDYGLLDLGIPGTNGPDRLQGGIPSFQIAGWSNLGNPNTGNPFLFRDNQYVGALNLTWIKGSHSLRFGLDYQDQQLNHFQPQGGTFQTARGTFQFNGNATMLQNAPAPADTRFNSWADFLLGMPTQGAGKVDQLRNPNSIRMQTYAVYAQDQWQITHKLTFNYGLRWELYPWPTRDHGGVSRFDPSTGLVYIGGAGDTPVDTGASVGAGQFLPRVGLAYRLGEKTVVRAGYGQSADPKPYIDFRNAYPINFAWSIPAATFNGKTNPYVPLTTLRIGLQENVYGIPPSLDQSPIPLPAGAGTTTFPKNADRQYIQSWNVAVQRELLSGLVGQLAYVGTRALGQQQFVNINASLPGTGNAGRPLSQFGILSDINMIEPFGDTVYNAMQAELRGRLSTAQFGIVYTLSRTTDYADNDSNPRIPLFQYKALDKGLAGYDRTQVVQTYGTWDLPFGKGQRWAKNGIAGAIVRGWQLNGLLTYMSGTPINIVQNNGYNLNAAGSGQVPDQVKTVAILGGIGPGHPYFDTSAFAQVNIPAGQPQRFGNFVRDSVRGPSFFNLDLSLFRTIDLSGKTHLQIRAEALNVLNHPNFANPGGDISTAGTFGIITSTVNEIGVTNTGERQIRLGARFSF